MPEIAIVETRECGGCYECSAHAIPLTITRWDVVSEKELEVLRKYYRGTYKGLSGNYWILERTSTENALKTVKKAVEDAILEAEKAAERKRKLEEAQLLRKQEKAKKVENKEREVFEKLKKKFEK